MTKKLNLKNPVYNLKTQFQNVWLWFWIGTALFGVQSLCLRYNCKLIERCCQNAGPELFTCMHFLFYFWELYCTDVQWIFKYWLLKCLMMQIKWPRKTRVKYCYSMKNWYLKKVFSLFIYFHQYLKIMIHIKKELCYANVISQLLN